MPHKPNQPADNPEQLKRFKEMARKVETDETPGAMDRAFNKAVRRTPPDSKREEIKRTPHFPNSPAPDESER